VLKEHPLTASFAPFFSSPAVSSKRYGTRLDPDRSENLSFCIENPVTDPRSKTSGAAQVSCNEEDGAGET
jgi:hypothetical protein